jgi:hypothetical protein
MLTDQRLHTDWQLKNYLETRAALLAFSMMIVDMFKQIDLSVYIVPEEDKAFNYTL